MRRLAKLSSSEKEIVSFARLDGLVAGASALLRHGNITDPNSQSYILLLRRTIASLSSYSELNWLY